MQHVAGMVGVELGIDVLRGRAITEHERPSSVVTPPAPGIEHYKTVEWVGRPTPAPAAG
jgi:hypothetical protein